MFDVHCTQIVLISARFVLYFGIPNQLDIRHMLHSQAYQSTIHCNSVGRTTHLYLYNNVERCNLVLRFITILR